MMTILRKIIMNCRSNWIIQMKSSYSLHIYGDGRNIPKIAVKWAHFGILWIMWNKSWPFLEWKWHKKRISLDKNGVWKFCKESLCIVQILVKSWGSENGKKIHSNEENLLCCIENSWIYAHIWINYKWFSNEKHLNIHHPLFSVGIGFLFSLNSLIAVIHEFHKRKLYSFILCG